MYRLRSARTLLVHLMLGLLLAGTLSACETSREVVEAVNPVNWISDDDEESTEPKPIPGEDGDFPQLGTVPENPAIPEIKREYEALRDGLLADKSNARYSDEIIRKQAPPTRKRPIPQSRIELEEPLPVEAPSEPPTVSEQVATAAPSLPQVSTEAPSPTAPPTPAPVPKAASGEALAESLQTAAVPRDPSLPPDPVAPSEAARPAPQPEPLAAPAPAKLTTSQPELTRAAAVPPSAADLGQSAGAGQAVREVASPVGETKLIATIYFQDGSARLTGRDLDVIDQVRQIYGRGGRAVRVIGHSSATTGESAERVALLNYKMSLDRATSVAQALMAEGLTQADIQVDARGDREPRFAETSEAGIAGNRRAEIYITF